MTSSPEVSSHCDESRGSIAGVFNLGVAKDF